MDIGDGRNLGQKSEVRCQGRMEGLRSEIRDKRSGKEGTGGTKVGCRTSEVRERRDRGRRV